MSDDVPERIPEITTPETMSGGASIDRMIRLASARACDRVVIAGKGHIGLLLELCRRGFVEAACESANCPHDGEIDALFIPESVDERELGLALRRHCRALRAGGTVVVRDARAQSRLARTRRLRALREMLSGAGLTPLVQEDDGRGFVLAATKPPIALGARASA